MQVPEWMGPCTAEDSQGAVACANKVGAQATMRTTREAVIFDPTAVEAVQPAGTYEVDVDEDLIEGLSLLAYRRVATTIYLPLRYGGLEAVRVDPRELDGAPRKLGAPRGAG